MARVARIVVPAMAHYVTQRGNRREDVFFDEEDREVYKQWLKEYADQKYITRPPICPQGWLAYEFSGVFGQGCKKKD